MMKQAILVLAALMAGLCYSQNYPGIIGGTLPAWVDPKNFPFGLPTFRPCSGPIWDGSPCPSDSYCWNIGVANWSLCRPYSMAIGNVPRPAAPNAPAPAQPAAPAAPTPQRGATPAPPPGGLIPDSPLSTFVWDPTPVPAAAVPSTMATVVKSA